MATSPLPSPGRIIGQHSYVSLAFSVPEKGTTLEVATSPLPSQGPKSGRNCCVTPHSRGVPTKWDTIRTGHISRAISGAHDWAELLCNPCVLWGPWKWGQHPKWLHEPCLLRAQNWAELLHYWCMRSVASSSAYSRACTLCWCMRCVSWLVVGVLYVWFARVPCEYGVLMCRMCGMPW